MKTLQTVAMAFLILTFMVIGNTGCVTTSSKQSPTTAGDPTVSGTIEIDETQVMFIVGGDMGGGTLQFQGQTYEFKTKGLKIGGFGIHKMKITGDVYKLTNVADFAGIYFAAEAGVTVVKGKTGFWMKNDKGVTLHLKGSAEGVALNLGVEGFHISMK